MPPIPSWKDDQTLGAGLDMMRKAYMLIRFIGQDDAPYLLSETSSLTRMMSSYQQLTTCCLRGRWKLQTSISLLTMITTTPNKMLPLSQVNHLHVNPLPFLSDLSALSSLHHMSINLLTEKDSPKAHTRTAVLLAMQFLLDFRLATMLELWESIGRTWRLEGWSLQGEQQH